MTSAPHETFPAFTSYPWLRHGFTQRGPGIDVRIGRTAALALLDEHHSAMRQTLGMSTMPFVAAEQVHGREVARIDTAASTCIAGADGLITDLPGICLGIYVADCCAVFLVDPERRAIGLLHSGKKGTDLGIVPAAVEKMRADFGCDPARMIAQLSPCIRPPHYEVDFAAQIAAQCRAAGIRQVFDCGICTACDLERYYSYRLEHGKTGRMLAMLALGADGV